MVAKDGASVETSHLYWPEVSRTRSFNFIDFVSLFRLVCGQKEYGNVFALLMEGFCSSRDVMPSSSDGSIYTRILFEVRAYLMQLYMYKHILACNQYYFRDNQRLIVFAK